MPAAALLHQCMPPCAPAALMLRSNANSSVTHFHLMLQLRKIAASTVRRAPQRCCINGSIPLDYWRSMQPLRSDGWGKG